MSQFKRTLRPYQLTDVDFLVHGGPRLGLFLDTRLGKTAIVLAAINEMLMRTACVLCPATGRISWPIEVAKWAPPGTKVHVQRPGVHPQDIKFTPGVLNILVVAYDALSREKPGAPKTWGQLINSVSWDVLVLDEGQALKSFGSNRTRAVYGPKTDGAPGSVVHKAKRVWVLSGSITPNHAGEMYPHYRALWPDTLSRPSSGPPYYRPLARHEFEDRFCTVVDTSFGRVIQGSRSVAQLRAALEHVARRRRKRDPDVMPDLPPVVHVEVPIPVPALNLAGVPALAGGYDKLTDDEFLAMLMREEIHLATTRRALGLAKVDAAAAWIEDQLNSGIPKMVVFGWHPAVLTGLFARLQDHNPQTLTGSTPPSARVRAVSIFQRDPTARLFLGQVLAAGTAIDLSAADEVVMVEPSWVPADNYQAYSRVENVGTRKATTVSWLYIPASLDQRIIRVQARKAVQAEALFG